MRNKINNLSKQTGIYIITNILNKKVYVGQAQTMTKYKGIYGRCDVHLYLLKRGKDSKHLQHAWNKYGEENFVFEELLLCPEEQCDYWEDYFIDVFKSWDRKYGYNIKRYACRTGPFSEDTKSKLRGRVMDPIIRKRINDAKRGVPRPQYVRDAVSKALKGRKLSKERCEQIRISSTGRKHSEETKTLLREQHIGMKHTLETIQKLREISTNISDETRRKMSEAGKDREFSEECREKISKFIRNTIWIHKGTQNKRILKNRMEEFPDWELGRYYSEESMKSLISKVSKPPTEACKEKISNFFKNSVWINLNGKNTRIHKEELESYLEIGWVRGRLVR